MDKMIEVPTLPILRTSHEMRLLARQLTKQADALDALLPRQKPRRKKTEIIDPRTLAGSKE